MNTLSLIDFGKRVKELRIKKGMTQEELALKCGYASRSTVNKIELGANDIPLSKLILLAEALDVSVVQLLSIDAAETIVGQYGSVVQDAFSLFAQLDQDDQAELRGEMKQMLKAVKYQ